jgi:hypothetical protein
MAVSPTLQQSNVKEWKEEYRPASNAASRYTGSDTSIYHYRCRSSSNRLGSLELRQRPFSLRERLKSLGR